MLFSPDSADEDKWRSHLGVRVACHRFASYEEEGEFLRSGRVKSEPASR
jgi:hypothetical protein